MPVIDLNKIKTEKHWTNQVKDKAKKAISWTVEKVTHTVEYVKANPKETAAILASALAVVKGASKGMHAVNRHRELKQEKWHREREVYDHSTGMYLQTNRKLKAADIEQINRIMRQTGKKKSEVMADLNLLRK